MKKHNNIIWKVFILLTFFSCLNVYIASATVSSIISWQPSSGTVDGYRLLYGTEKGNYTSEIDVGPVTEYALDNITLKENTTYYFIVKAYNSAGESGESNELVWTSGDATPPLPPESLSFNESTKMLTWNLNSEPDLSGYNFYYGTSSRDYGPPVSLGKVSNYSLSGFEDHKYGALTALDTSGNESGFSEEISISIQQPISPAPDSLISNLSVASNKDYLIESALDNGKKSYIDRSYTYQNVPDSLKNAHFIVPANDDKSQKDNSFLSLDVNQQVTVYIAFDSRAASAPAWLDGFSNTGMELISADVPMILYKKEFNAGTVTLGGNEVGYNMYTVIVSTDISEPAPEPTELAITDLSVATGKGYLIEPGLDNGKTSYIDRNYTYQNVPDSLKNAHFIVPANNDKTQNNDSFLSFDVNQEVAVYIAFDSRAASAPTWLDGFTNTGMELISADVPMILYKKEFNAGTVTLGGNEVGYNMYTVIISTEAQSPEPDTEAPALAITSPTSGSTYDTQSDKISLAGSASDNTGISEITWQNDQGDSGVASGTSDWTISDIELAEGVNTITITATDEADNKTEKSIAVTYTIPDTEPPALAITSPTSGSTYDTQSNSISLAGSASDNTGIAEITWQNDQGDSGVASGTSDWTISDIELAEGVNNLTIIATDTAGNVGSNTLAVTYTKPVPPAPDATVSNQSAASGKDYLIESGLDNGRTSYIDRSYTYQDVPDSLKTADFIIPANNDKSLKNDSFLTFDVNQQVAVYVAFDSRAASAPSWLAGFTNTGLNLISADVPMVLYRKNFNAGTVTLGGNEVGYNMYTVIVSTDISEPAPEPTELAITDLSVATGKGYLIASGLDNGKTSYIDRNYTYQNVPDSLKNAHFIVPANNDKSQKDDSFLSFDVNQETAVYIAFDSRAASAPSWLADFTNTGLELISADVPMILYKKEFNAGTVTLGGNEVGFNMYTVILTK